MKQFKNVTILVFTALLLLCPTKILANTDANQIFRISPVIINVPLSPDKTYQDEITIENLTKKALPLTTSLNDFETTGEEGGYVFPDSHTSPLLSWITLSQNAFILNPKEKKKIVLTIKTPVEIPLGGYYGMLFFQSVPLNDTNATTHVIPKVGVLLLANIGVLDPKAKKIEIETFSTDFLHQDGTIPLLLRVKNISLHFLTVKPILTVTPLLTRNPTDHKPAYLEDKIIFQGKIRRWEQTIDMGNMQPNIYKAHLAVSTGNGEYVSSDRYFIVFPLVKVIFWGSICLISIFFFIKRKQIKRALTILIFNK